MILPARNPDDDPRPQADPPDAPDPTDLSDWADMLNAPDREHLDPQADCFKPPAEPTEVGCLHCQHVFMSDQMQYRISTDIDGKQRGFWCCPDPKCDGKGFLFDLYPTDPEWRDEEGNLVWSQDDGDDDEEWDDELDGPGDGLGFEPHKDWTPETDDEEDIPF